MWNSIRRCTRVAAMALLASLGSAAPSTAASLAISVQHDGSVVAIHASAWLDADTATAWRVLTDYNRYTEFIPDLRLSRVVARHGATVRVEQSGDAALWLFKVPLEITFEIEETPPNSLQSRAVAGSLRALVSSYALTPAGPGMRLDYAGRVAPGFVLFGPIEQAAVEHNVARQLQALADEIERQGAVARSHSMAGVK
jgi:hypothetical protein